MLTKLTLQLKQRERYVAAAFIKSLPEFLASVGAVFVLVRLLPMSEGNTLTPILRMIVVPLAILFWLMRFVEHYGEVKQQ